LTKFVPVSILKIIGANVRHYRKLQKWSQERLAEESGLHPTYISGIERGIRNVSGLNIERLAKAFHISPSKLLES
jgi:transcriptional regulator with XRE-family HTH domain